MESIIFTPYKAIEDYNFSSDSILNIDKSSFDNIQFQEGKTTINFINCKFQKLVIDNNEVIDFNNIIIYFYGCYIKEIDTCPLVSENISLNFYSSILSGRVNSSVLKNISLNNSIINGGFFLLNQKIIDISYTEENIFPRVWKNLVHGLTSEIQNDIFKTLQSYHIQDSKKITFRTSEVKDKKYGYNLNSSIGKGKYRIGYYLNDSQKASFNLNLNILYSQKIEDSETSILNSSFNSLSLGGHLNGKLNIENVKIENWFIREFSGQKDISFYNICPLNLPEGMSKLEIHKSNLDSTWFDNIDFSEYKTVSFYRTKFGKTTFTSCNFPTDYTSFEKFQNLENVHYPEKKPNNYYKNQYEIYLQLKILLESSGNFYEAQKLQAISNEALKKIDQISNWDKAILCINSKSNNHGLSIKRPLLFFLFFSISFYILYLYSLDRIFNSNELDYSLFGYYFSFIDLTHRSDFLVNRTDFNFSSLTFDFLNKVVSGFFIYQFIAAFRKYGKR